MARRRLLGDDLWARLLDPPTDEREVARFYTPTAEDLALIATRRTDATRLGCTLLLLYLRHPGSVLEAEARDDISFGMREARPGVQQGVHR